jgi:hypothetical protein
MRVKPPERARRAFPSLLLSPTFFILMSVFQAESQMLES